MAKLSVRIAVLCIILILTACVAIRRPQELRSVQRQTLKDTLKNSGKYNSPQKLDSVIRCIYSP